MASDLIGHQRGSAVTPGPGRGPGARVRARARRDLVHQDRVVARLAELHHIRDLLDAAGAVISGGWVQHGWLVRTRAPAAAPAVGVAVVGTSKEQEGPGACLVAAIAVAGGDSPGVYTQAVQRTLDLVWHTLYGGTGQMPHQCPAPGTRLDRNRDLALWNDAADRTRHDVTALLVAAGKNASREIHSLRSP